MVRAKASSIVQEKPRLPSSFSERSSHLQFFLQGFALCNTSSMRFRAQGFGS